MRLGAVLLVCACGSSSSSPDGGGGGGDDAPIVDAAPPAAICQATPLAATTGAHVVGTGTAASCTEQALRDAAAQGGAITFDCGGKATITVASAISFTKETVVDGGGMITLSGGSASRILYLDSDYNTPTPRLTVQRLDFVDGKGPDDGDDTARGGGAIYRDGGSLTVIDCNFSRNHAGATGQDLAGGAIYAFGGGETVISGSTFANNSASDGGAVGSLNGDVTIVNTTFTTNQATGSGGNPGDGGCGGALYQDGRDEKTSLCGVTLSGNSAGAIGGAVFRVSNDNTGAWAMDRSSVDGNSVTSTTDGNAGGLYLQGLAMTISASSITHNQAFYNGGAWLSTGTVELTNSTIAENTATGSNGGGLWLAHSPTGHITNCTIANNKSAAPGQIAGAIFGDGLTLVNTVVANNTAQYTPGCDKSRTDGSGDLQWPAGALCVKSSLVADPQLGALTDGTLSPASGSPARGLGTSACPATDQLGHPRSTPCTAGALE